MDKRVDGHTIWGKRWLRVLLDIDSKGIIERALKQSQKWAVSDLEVNNNVIKARVSENAKKSFYLQFFMQRWEDDDIKTFVKNVADNPLLAASIQKGEISNPGSLAAIESSLEKAGLKLFPTKWGDLKMFCSCPSWSMPCMHVAIVLYRLAFKVDNDPFILFRLHGMDLIKETTEALGTEADTAIDIEPLSNMLDYYDPEDAAPESIPTDEEPSTEPLLASLHDMGFIYSSVLPDSPGFCTTDNFRRHLEYEIESIAKKVQQMLNDPEQAHLAVKSQKSRVKIETHHTYTVKQDITPDSRWSFRQLMRVFQASDDELKEAGDTAFPLHLAVITALHLIASKAIVPRIGSTKEGSFAIRWTPAMMEAQVRTIVDRLGHLLPPDIIKAPGGRSHKSLPPRNQAEILLTLIISNTVLVLSSIQSNNKCHNTFFYGAVIPATNTSGAEKIKRWLDHINIGSHRYNPIIVLEDLEKEATMPSVFGIDIAFDIDGETRPLRAILDDVQFDNIRNTVILEVSMLSPYLGKLHKYMLSGARQPMEISNSEFVDFLTKTLPRIELMGIRIMIPDTLRSLVKPSIRRVIDIQPGGVGHLSLAEMLDIKWEVSFGESKVATEEFAKVVRSANRIYRYKGRFFYLDKEELERLRRSLNGESAPTSSELLQSALSEEFRGDPVQLSEEVRRSISILSQEPELAVPRTLKGKLRPYQKRGYEWMYRNCQLGFGSIIADDMGLGKTIQVIALLLKLKREHAKEHPHFLVIVPTTLVTNWQSELERFAPNLKYTVYHGSNRDIDKFSNDLLLTTYGIVRSDYKALSDQEWNTVVIDEAQNIKNPTTAQSKAVRHLKARNHIAMSGTPIENRMAEFWSIMDFANHGYLGSAEKFRSLYAIPIETNGDKKCAERFRNITAPFLLRRLKSDRSIIDDLPDKIEENNYVELTAEQTKLYEQTANEALTVIENSNKETAQSLFKRQGMVLQMIMALKQICNHPALFTGKSHKRHKEPQPEQSGKSARLVELVQSIVENDHKVLIFTQFKEMGDMLTKFIRDAIDEEPLFLHGGCSTKERKTMVDQFQNSNRHHVFILSIKAGGTGLNLTAASHVIHYDLWWNPAVESQATDRAYRIGQHQNVIVHRFITKETFEEQIDRMLQEKKRLADMTVATGESWIARLSDEELGLIFGKKM